MLPRGLVICGIGVAMPSVPFIHSPSDGMKLLSVNPLATSSPRSCLTFGLTVS